jgi:molybdate transport repressor ModE-like protein
VSGGRKVNRVALLEKVAELGSITAAAKAVGVSCQDACALIKASHIFLAVNS